MTFKGRSAMGCAAMMAVLFAAGDLRGFECLDDFEDGSVTDGSPCTWTMSYNSGSCSFGPWQYHVEDGKLFLGNNPTDFAGAFIEEILTGDVSVRIQGMSVGGGTVVGAIINIDAPICGSSYAGWVNTDGSMGIAQTISSVGTYIATGLLVPPPSPGEVLILQFDWTKGELQLRIWRPGEKMPKEPLLRAVPTAIIPSGWAAAYCWGSVAYDYIWIWSGPSAVMRVDPESGTAPLDVTVDGSASTTEAGHNLVGYEWDFGDGAVAEGVEASHTYAEAGRYTIWLTVTDDRGLNRLASREIVVSCPPSDTSPWQVADIGQPFLSGSAWFEGSGATGDLHLCTAGSRIVLRKDDFLFLYREISGDFRVTARIAGTDHMETNNGAAGVMVRLSLDEGAIAGATLLNGPLTSSSRKVRFSHRPALDEIMSNSIQDIEPGDGPVWVRLERQGETLTGSHSLDGVAWTETGKKENAGLQEKVLVGVAACKGAAIAGGADPGALAAVFDNLELKFELTDRPFRRGDANVDGVIDISDPVFILNSIFLGIGTITCRKAADGNNDGLLDISDPVFLLSYQFIGGKAPDEPFPYCGTDQVPDLLTCESFDKCQ